jgi:hypothetical protein
MVLPPLSLPLGKDVPRAINTGYWRRITIQKLMGAAFTFGRFGFGPRRLLALRRGPSTFSRFGFTHPNLGQA